MRNILHRLGLHFWRKSGNISRTCTQCSKKQYEDIYTGGGWINEEDL